MNQKNDGFLRSVLAEAFSDAGIHVINWDDENEVRQAVRSLSDDWHAAKARKARQR